MSAVLIRQANHDDLDFIIDLIEMDSNDQHYHAIYCKKSHLKEFKCALRDVIEIGSMARMGNNGVEAIGSFLHVIYLESGERVGFTLLSEKNAGSTSTELELYMISIAPNHRHKGCGKLIVDYILEDLPHGTYLYARCYPASVHMYNLLLNRGFKQIGVTASGTRELEYLKV